MAGHGGRPADPPTESKDGSDKDTDGLFILNHVSVTSALGMEGESALVSP